MTVRVIIELACERCHRAYGPLTDCPTATHLRRRAKEAGWSIWRPYGGGVTTDTCPVCIVRIREEA